MTALVINVGEDQETAARWAEGLRWRIPVLLDLDGSVAASFAPQGLRPDMPREKVPVAANLIIDRAGRIRFYELFDAGAFDAELVGLRATLDELLAAE